MTFGRNCENGTTFVEQKGYILDIVNNHGVSDRKPISTTGKTAIERALSDEKEIEVLIYLINP